MRLRCRSQAVTWSVPCAQAWLALVQPLAGSSAAPARGAGHLATVSCAALALQHVWLQAQ